MKSFKETQMTTLPSNLIDLLIEGFDPRNLDIDEQNQFVEAVKNLTVPSYESPDCIIFECLEDTADDIEDLRINS